jgi:hypothetical protein
VLSGKDDWLSDEQKYEHIHGMGMKGKCVVFKILLTFYFVVQFFIE